MFSCILCAELVPIGHDKAEPETHVKNKLPHRPKLDDRLVFAVPPEMKRSLYEVAALRGRTAADLAREAIAAVVRSGAARAGDV